MEPNKEYIEECQRLMAENNEPGAVVVIADHAPTEQDLASGEQNIGRFETVGKLQAEMGEFADTWEKLGNSI